MDSRDRTAGDLSEVTSADGQGERIAAEQKLAATSSEENRDGTILLGDIGLESPVPQQYRLWITSYDDWRPAKWSEAPPAAVVLEPADAGSHTAESARCFLEGFNTQMLACDRAIWAVAIPVALRYEGDARPGDRVRGHEFADGE